MLTTLPGMDRSGASLDPDIGALDDLAPFRDLALDQLREVGGRSAEHDAVEIRQLPADARLGEARIDLAVEGLDDFRRRVPGRAEAVEKRRLESAEELRDARHAVEARHAAGRRDAQRPQ